MPILPIKQFLIISQKKCIGKKIEKKFAWNKRENCFSSNKEKNSKIIWAKNLLLAMKLHWKLFRICEHGLVVASIQNYPKCPLLVFFSKME